MRLGVLPFLLLIAVVVFTLLSDNFLTSRNLLNVARQSTYLIMVSMGQMFALLTGGFDLSVGTILAVTSVVGALAMSTAYAAMPDALALAIALGLLAGFAAGVAIGVMNGIGVALFNVSPFMMTLGMASIGFGIALYLTGGVPVYGMPQEFGDIFGFGSWLGVPAPVWVTAALIVLLVPAGQLDAPRPLLLCRGRQHQGGAALRHQHAAHSVHGLCAVRRPGRDLRPPADRPARDRRGQHRRVDAAGIDRRLRDRGREPARRRRPDRERGPGRACSSAWSRTA